MKPMYTDLTDDELSTRVKALEELKDESERTCRGTAKASRL